jgi:trans-aconitate methyltransferase
VARMRHHHAVNWLPDELASSGVEHLTVDDIAAYERRRRFDPSGEIDLLRDLGLSGRDRIVEFGPGPGAFSIAAAQVVSEVIAVDPSLAMCSYLGQRAVEAGLDNVTIVNAGFLTYEHRGPPVRFVFSKNALHHLPDFWKAEALGRIHSMLEPGGVLRLRDLVLSVPPDQALERISAWIDDTASDEGWSREALVGHFRSEFSTYTWILEATLSAVGFDITDTEYTDSGIFARYTCRAGQPPN